MERKVIDATFEGNNPTIEQVMGIYALAAKIINYESAAIGLHLKRRLIKPDGWTVDQIHRLNGHFAADNDDRSGDFYPAFIVSVNALYRCGPVIMQVEYFDDLAVHFDRMRNPDVASLRLV